MNTTNPRPVTILDSYPPPRIPQDGCISSSLHGPVEKVVGIPEPQRMKYPPKNQHIPRDNKAYLSR